MKKEVDHILSKEEKSSIYQHEEGNWPFTDQWREVSYLPTWRKKLAIYWAVMGTWQDADQGKTSASYQY